MRKTVWSAWSLAVIALSFGWAGLAGGHAQEVPGTQCAEPAVTEYVNDDSGEGADGISPVENSEMRSSVALPESGVVDGAKSDQGQVLEQRASVTELKNTLDPYFNANPALGRGTCAAYFKVLDSERVLYSYRGNVPMIPASNLKVATTATALDMLGADFRFTTELWGEPVDANGVIAGNLYLRSNGDPTNTPPWQESPEAMYEKLAQTLQEAGVRHIDGDIVGDDSCFDRRYYPEGWAEHYHLDSYSAPVAGLSLNGNMVEVRVQGSSITTYPESNYFKIAYSPEGAADTAVERERGSNVIKVCGPLSDVNRHITVDSPPMFAVTSFAKILARHGITCGGRVRLIHSVGEPACVTNKHNYAAITSPPLLEIITEINQQSDNFLAEHVFKTLGARYVGKGNASTSEACVKHFMEHNHIDTSGMKMADGCGLSTLDRIAPCQLVGVLSAMANKPEADMFRNSLASGEHGTLKYRMGGLNVFGKTGTLGEVSSLSGYVTTARGQVVVFSMIFNNMDDLGVAIDIENNAVGVLARWNELL